MGRRDQRILLRILNSVYVQINIKAWPVKMILVEKFDGEYLRKGRVSEPGKEIEVEKQFLVAYQYPETVRRDIENLNR
jgi:hypothetical protein